MILKRVHSQHRQWVLMKRTFYIQGDETLPQHCCAPPPLRVWSVLGETQMFGLHSRHGILTEAFFVIRPEFLS